MAAEPVHVDDVPGGDPVLEALAHERRRRALAALQDAGGPLSLAELAAELARRERGPGGNSRQCESAERIQIGLYHCHVPKLSEAGLVDFDVDERTVAPAETDALVDRRRSSA